MQRKNKARWETSQRAIFIKSTIPNSEFRIPNFYD